MRGGRGRRTERRSVPNTQEKVGFPACIPTKIFYGKHVSHEFKRYNTHLRQLALAGPERGNTQPIIANCRHGWPSTNRIPVASTYR